MNALPRLASVALISRCGELLLPAFHTLWKAVPEGEDLLVRRAIGDAAETAKSGMEADGLSTIAEEITKLVGRFELHLNGIPVETTELPETVTSLIDAQIRTIRDIIDVAARAARAATADDLSGASSECSDGISWAFSVAEDLGDPGLSDKLNETISSLTNYCDSSQITDETKVWWTGAEWQSEH